MKRTTFKKYCVFRLPSSAASDVGKPYWTDNAIDAMDRAFCERMLRQLLLVWNALRNA
jgi:hypothetical protein